MLASGHPRFRWIEVLLISPQQYCTRNPWSISKNSLPNWLLKEAKKKKQFIRFQHRNVFQEILGNFDFLSPLNSPITSALGVFHKSACLFDLGLGFHSIPPTAFHPKVDQSSHQSLGHTFSKIYNHRIRYSVTKRW